MALNFFQETFVGQMTIILSVGKILPNKMRYKLLLRPSSKIVIQELLIIVSSHHGLKQAHLGWLDEA